MEKDRGIPAMVWRRNNNKPMYNKINLRRHEVNVGKSFLQNFFEENMFFIKIEMFY